MPAGIGKTLAASITTSSAYDPVPVNAATRSPAFRLVTPGPTSLTTPAASMPGVKGKAGFSWYCPETSSRSAKLIPAACTAMRTAPSRIGGDEASPTTSFSGPPHSLHKAARMKPPSRFDPGHCKGPVLTGGELVSYLRYLLTTEARRHGEKDC